MNPRARFTCICWYCSLYGDKDCCCISVTHNHPQTAWPLITELAVVISQDHLMVVTGTHIYNSWAYHVFGHAQCMRAWHWLKPIANVTVSAVNYTHLMNYWSTMMIDCFHEWHFLTTACTICLNQIHPRLKWLYAYPWSLVQAAKVSFWFEQWAMSNLYLMMRQTHIKHKTVKQKLHICIQYRNKLFA